MRDVSGGGVNGRVIVTGVVREGSGGVLPYGPELSLLLAVVSDGSQM